MSGASVSNELTTLGAAELARRIRAGDTSPLEVVDAHIARIEEVEPHINALITTTFDAARSTARRMTDARVPADPPPLHGVPITVKDAFAVAGVRFTAGSDRLREHVAERDAEAVRRLRAAGAIVLGKSSCSDMSGSMETTNPIIGLDRAVTDAAGVLGAVGMTARRRAALPLTRALFETVALLHRHFLPSHRRALGGDRSVSVWRALRGRRSGDVRVSTACLAPVAYISACGPFVRTLGFGRAGLLDALRARFLDTMRDGAVLLLPVFATTARRHGFSWGPYGNLGLTLIFNALGFPAAAVPLGLSRDGLPLSAQIVARPDEDHVALAVAAVLEREFGGWRMAPPG